MKRKLAILDDEPSIAMIIELNLNDSFEINSFQDKDSFETHAAENEIDALILDLNLAGESGRALIGEIRQGHFAKLNSKIPIVILSGEESTSEKIQCLQIGADDYLVKPFNPVELKVRIQRIFSRIDE